MTIAQVDFFAQQTSLARRATMPSVSTAAVIADNVRRNVRRYREERGMSQEDLAAASGLSRSTIAAVEGGRYSDMESKTIAQLATGLGVQLQDLTGEPSGPMPLGEAIDAFLISDWSGAVKPSADEIRWLRALPAVMWVGTPPTAETIAELLLWKRRHA